MFPMVEEERRLSKYPSAPSLDVYLFPVDTNGSMPWPALRSVVFENGCLTKAATGVLIASERTGVVDRGAGSMLTEVVVAEERIDREEGVVLEPAKAVRAAAVSQLGQEV